MMNRVSGIIGCWIVIALIGGSVAPLSAQHRVPGWGRVAPPGGHQSDLQLLRPGGGPVIPIFEGWYQNPDGTHQLCFGYFNTNTEEVLEIPIGRDNHVEPEELNGLQPTHFLPVPPGGRRHYCIFSATVPGDWGDKDLVWTLRDPREHGLGQEYASPGRLRYEQYHLEELLQESRENSAPRVRLDADGPEARGRTPAMLGPYTGKAGEPIPVTVQVRRDNPFDPGDRQGITLRWYKYQGTGDVTFGVVGDNRRADDGRILIPSSGWLEAEGAWGEAVTELLFAEPGEYRVLLQAYNDSGGRTQPSDFEFYCCWTNLILDVTVTP
jgi:hypothetical protein